MYEFGPYDELHGYLSVAGHPIDVTPLPEVPIGVGDVYADADGSPPEEPVTEQSVYSQEPYPFPGEEETDREAVTESAGTAIELAPPGELEPLTVDVEISEAATDIFTPPAREASFHAVDWQSEVDGKVTRGATVWYPTADEPGLVVARANGSAPMPETELTNWCDDAQCIDFLANAGLRPILEAVGISSRQYTDPEDPEVTVTEVTIPQAEVFCERANAAIAALTPPGVKPFSFKTFQDGDRVEFTACEMLAAVADKSILISTKINPNGVQNSIGVHDTLVHAVTYLAIACMDHSGAWSEALAERAAGVRQQARDIGLDPDQRKIFDMDNMAYYLESTINVTSFVSIVRGGDIPHLFFYGLQWLYEAWGDDTLGRAIGDVAANLRKLEHSLT